jgi:hypothetical protein
MGPIDRLHGILGSNQQMHSIRQRDYFPRATSLHPIFSMQIASLTKHTNHTLMSGIRAKVLFKNTPNSFSKICLHVSRVRHPERIGF